MFSKNFSQDLGSDTVDSQYDQNDKQLHMKVIPTDEETKKEEMRKKEVEKEKELQENYEREEEEGRKEEERQKEEDEKSNENEERKEEEERQERKEEQRKRREEEEDEQRRKQEEKDKEEESKFDGTYHCLYHYGTHKIKLAYDIPTKKWKNIRVKCDDEEEKQLNVILNNLKSRQFFVDYTLDQQIQIIKKKVDHYFFEMDQMERVKRNNSKMPTSSTVLNNENQISSTISKDNEQQKDIVDYGFHSFMINSRSKFSDSVPPPVAPRRSRQNSACSTQSSVRYASFLSPPTAPVRRRRVIESILLHVQRKKKIFEKIVDTLRGIERPKMYDLGLEFLHLYDGRFNYREGHTFVMPFRRNTWFLTIDQIKWIDCPLGEAGPRSVLILKYKDHYERIHV